MALHGLLKLVDEQTVLHVFRIKSPNPEKLLICRLYRYLVDNDYDEDTAARLLYGPASNSVDARYRSSKSRLKEVLIQALLLQVGNYDRYDSYDRAYVYAAKRTMAIRILVANRAYAEAKDLATTTFHRIKQYEIIEFNEDLTDVLTGLYLGLFFNRKHFERYDRLHQYYVDANYDLAKVKRVYRQLRKMVYAHEMPQAEIGKLALACSRELDKYRQRYSKSSNMQNMIASTEVLGYTLQGRFQEAIASLDSGEQALRACEGYSSVALSMLALARVDCAVRLRNFDRACREIEKAHDIIPKDTINSVKLAEYGYLLGMQTGNYQYAYEAFNTHTPKVRGRLLSAEHNQAWIIYEAYINFLIQTGRIDVEGQQHKIRKFAMNRFLREVPNYARDKKGRNIQIIIIQIAYLIINENFGEIMDRTDAMARYCSRYLRDDENLRNNCFFKMLLAAEKSEFHATATAQKTKRVYERMTSQRSVELAKSTSTEIIPYEALWDILSEWFYKPREGVRSRARS